MKGSREILLAGVSSLAFALAAPAAMAADLPVKAPPPAPVPQNEWTWWVEGGAQGVLGGPYVPGLIPAFDPRPSNWGWDAAGSLDYRFNGYWHISGDFRYGQNHKTSVSNQFACITSCTKVYGRNSASRKEDNWVADFMVGREIGLGGGTSQIKGGVRVAEIRGTTNGNMLLVSGFGSFVSSAYTQTNKFLGVGPRLALEGTVPIGGAWFIDYMGGLAGLYGHQSTDQVATNITSGGACTSGCPINASTSGNGFVFNPDAMLGIAYALSPTTKLAINYHVDAYFSALRVFTPTGAAAHTDRIYHGPSLRLTMQLP